MALGLVGQKCGMTRKFTENGDSTPVTIVMVDPNRITQLKNLENDGYCAVQVTTGTRKKIRVTKPQAGHFAKAKSEPGRGLWEFRVTAEFLEDKALGDALDVTCFSEGQMVDVKGVSKGKGYAGVVKRHNFSTQDATHGNSLAHRAPGSIGQNQTPGRVFKGKKMAGQLGSKACTVRNLKIIQVDTERNLLMIGGAIPGATGSDVVILPASADR